MLLFSLDCSVDAAIRAAMSAAFSSKNSLVILAGGGGPQVSTRVLSPAAHASQIKFQFDVLCLSDNLSLIIGWRESLQGDFKMFQVMIVAKISTGTHLAVTSQLAQCDTREQADALCDGVEKQNKDSRALPGFSAATIKLYKT
jgi:hypothetical protein